MLPRRCTALYFGTMHPGTTLILLSMSIRKFEEIFLLNSWTSIQTQSKNVTDFKFYLNYGISLLEFKLLEL